MQNRILALSVWAKGLIAALLLFYLLGFFEPVRDALAITPGKVPPPEVKLFTLLTGGLMEWSIVNLALDVAAVVYFSSILEQYWGPHEFLIFTGIVTVASCFSATIFYIFAFALTRDLSMLFFQFNGFIACVTGYCVAYKQVFPGKKLSFKGFTVDCRLVPLCLFVAHVVLWQVFGYPAAQCVLSGSGLLTAFVYLRFYQRREGLVGDASDSFEFADLFPSQIQAPIRVIAAQSYRILLFLRICHKRQQAYDLGGPSSIRISMPGVNDADAERRRQIALRDLETRMGIAKPHTGSGDDSRQTASSPPPIMATLSPASPPLLHASASQESVIINPTPPESSRQSPIH